jgi:hypothetical protein
MRVTSADGVDVTAAPKRRWLSKGYLVTMGTVLALTAGLGLTVLGLGSADQAVASYDAASWVWSEAKSEVARINGITAKVDTRVNVPKANGHEVAIAQNDRFVILRDQTTGAIGTMDLSTLQEQWNNSQNSGAGQGVRVALDEHSAFVIDTVQGQVQQIDPATLGPIGQALHFTPGITGGEFDGKGRLWIASPSEGTVTAITPLATPSGSTGGPAAGSPAESPVQTTTVATPSHDLALSTMGDGVAVLDRTTNQLTTIRAGRTKNVTLPLAGPGQLSDKVDGEQVPVTVTDSRHVYVVNDKTGGQTDFSVPGDGTSLEPAVAWQGFFYVADSASGSVHVFDSAGKEQKGFGFTNPGGPLDMEVREGYLFINAPGSSTAKVVDDAHTVRTVDKYADDILGGDPPKTPPAPPPPPRKPSKPVVSRPGPPRNVRAAAGNATATVSWQAAAQNGAPILRYVVDGAGKTFQVGADQRSLAVTGLTNGETYRFTVHAVNRKGDGPAKTSNAVRPTSEVPDAPTAVTAEAKPDGTVVVSWPEANGQGLAISRDLRGRQRADRRQHQDVADGRGGPAGVRQAVRVHGHRGQRARRGVEGVAGVGQRGAVHDAGRAAQPRREHRRRAVRCGQGGLAGGAGQRAADHQIRGDGGRQVDRRGRRDEHDADRVRRRGERAGRGAGGQRGRSGRGGRGHGEHGGQAADHRDRHESGLGQGDGVVQHRQRRGVEHDLQDGRRRWFGRRQLLQPGDRVVEAGHRVQVHDHGGQRGRQRERYRERDHRQALRHRDLQRRRGRRHRALLRRQRRGAQRQRDLQGHPAGQQQAGGLGQAGDEARGVLQEDRRRDRLLHLQPQQEEHLVDSGQLQRQELHPVGVAQLLGRRGHAERAADLLRTAW